MKKLWLLSILLIPTITLASCSTNNKNDVSVATIQQVMTNSNSIQDNALYQFDNGKLSVSISFSPFQKPTSLPADNDFSEIFKNDVKQFNKDFPKNKLSDDDDQTKFEENFKNVVFKIDKSSNEIVLKNKNINKVFKISESNDNRLIDSIGNEYELKIIK